MSYQQNIYSQNGKCNRNFVGPVPTTSSDICVFNRPGFTMSGASSIDCPEVTCSISGVPYNDIFTGTTDCFVENELSGSCFNSIDWVSNVYEDDVLVYSNAFYSSTSLSGSVIDITTFSGSVVTAFDTLGYTYSFDNEEFTIDKEVRFENIKLELTTELDYSVGCEVTGFTSPIDSRMTSCSCPDGYNPTTDEDACQKLSYSAATLNGTPITANAGTTNVAYGANGTRFYPIIDGMTFPLVRNLNEVNLRQGNTGGPSVIPEVAVSSDFWGRYNPPTKYGRLNDISLATPTYWVGFSKCIDIPVSGVYYIGVAADNYCRLSLNGELILELTGTVGNNFKIWHMLPVTLSSGINIIEMEGKDDGSVSSAFGAEIYGADLETLTGATTTGTTELIFSTKDLLGETYTLGETNGYSCSGGYAYDACYSGTPRCVLVDNVDITCIFTGSCETNDVICDLDFSGITLNDTNVYVLTGQTEFDLTFEFTGNTESFDSTNASFKYEIYKYSTELGYFDNVPIFISEYFDWETISGSSAFTTSVTASTIDPDGQYIVKGQYLHNVCTEFATLLNYKYTTASSPSGGEIYGQYEPTRDFYFLAFEEAEKPRLAISSGDTNTIGSLIASSIILDGTTNTFNLPYSESEYIIALNGLTLAPGYDYSSQFVDLDSALVKTVTLSGGTISGDVLTYIYSNNTDQNSLKSDTFSIDNPIVSGVTDGEGSNSIYYNTTKGKYEIFLDMTPVSSNDIAITLNGVTLANNIDYYQSTSNPKRIILNGTIIVGDIINAYYNALSDVVGDQFGTTINVGWTIETPPSEDNGIFTLQISSDENFNTIVSSATTNYTVGATGYNALANLVGNVGDEQYYRVKNEKNFITLCNETLTTTAYSETGYITIQTNVNNSY